MAPQIYQSAVKELTSKSPKSKVGGFHLLKELASVSPDAFKDSNFVEGIVQALVPASSTALKTHALEFLRAVVHPKTAVHFVEKLPDIIKSVLIAVNDVYYKIVAEALRVIGQIVKTMAGVEQFKLEPFIPDISSNVLTKLKLTDVDLEVKDTAMEATGLLVSLLGSKLSSAHQEEFLAILNNRLTNELTRVNSIRTLSQIEKQKLVLVEYLEIQLKH